MTPSAIPPGRALRVVGDVHGDIHAFAYAAETDRFLVQLGDLVDGGPDSAGVLRLMFQRLDAGEGVFLLGNHDRKLGRLLAGERVTISPELSDTTGQLDEALRVRALTEIARAPAWLRWGRLLFVHAGFHTDMLHTDPPPGLGRVTHVLSRALFGQTTSRMQPDGYPERKLDWVKRIPPWLTVYCGHDRRSTDGRPLTVSNHDGGRAIFMDTGAGKGGHLSWVDIDTA